MEKTYMDEINKKKIEDRTALEELLSFKLDENISKEVIDLLENIYITKKTKITNDEWKKIEVERLNMEIILGELNQVLKDFEKTVENEDDEEDEDDKDDEEDVKDYKKCSRCRRYIISKNL